jgi:hypothetical protein
MELEERHNLYCFVYKIMLALITQIFKADYTEVAEKLFLNADTRRLPVCRQAGRRIHADFIDEIICATSCVTSAKICV